MRGGCEFSTPYKSVCVKNGNKKLTMFRRADINCDAKISSCPLTENNYILGITEDDTRSKRKKTFRNIN